MKREIHIFLTTAQTTITIVNEKGREAPIMNVVIRFTKREQNRAMPILVRHAPGMLLQGGYLILPQRALAKLREEKVRFKLVGKIEF